MIKKFLDKVNKEKLKVVLALIVFLQPIISLDYLIYGFLNQFNLPRIATVVSFLIIPLLILIGFLVFEHNRIRAFVLSFIYGFVVLVYFYFHTKNAILIRNDLYLPNNFQFSTFKELFYVLTLIIPYYLIYLFYIADFSEDLVKKVMIGLSTSISLPIMFRSYDGSSRSSYARYRFSKYEYGWCSNGSTY